MTELNLTPAPDAGPLMVSVSKLAELKDITRQSMKERVDRLEAAGVLSTRREKGQRLVSLAAFDAATNEQTDPARLIGAETAAAGRGESGEQADAPRSSSPTYNEQLTRKARYDADLREMEVRRKRGELLPVDEVRVAMERCAERIVRKLDQLPGRADDIAAAVADGGSAKAREVMKRIVREMRIDLVEAMTLGEEDPNEFADAA